MKLTVVGTALLFFGLIAVGPARGQAPQPAAASIGLQTGQRAPAYALVDQFGREQSNETMKGAHGTVLLFFRSADW